MRSTRGFTLVELLTVVVIIGVLAGLAIPKFANTKQKGYLASMKSDLRNLVTAQEAYFADYVTYAVSVDKLNYNISAGNSVAVTGATGTGWSATASNNGTLQTCGIFVGSATPPISGEQEGAATCR